MHDVPLALRQLARRPGSGMLAILTIGVALGATVGIGTIVDHPIRRYWVRRSSCSRCSLPRPGRFPR